MHMNVNIVLRTQQVLWYHDKSNIHIAQEGSGAVHISAEQTTIARCSIHWHQHKRCRTLQSLTSRSFKTQYHRYCSCCSAAKASACDGLSSWTALSNTALVTRCSQASHESVDYFICQLTHCIHWLHWLAWDGTVDGWASWRWPCW